MHGYAQPHRRSIQLLFTALTITLLLSVPQESRAQEKPLQFVRESMSVQQVWPSKKSFELRRARVRLPDPQQATVAEEERALSFDFFGDVTLRGDVAGAMTGVNDVHGMRGSIRGQRHGNFVLSQKEGRWSGHVRLPSENKAYQIRYDRRLNTHLVTEIDLSKRDLPPCEGAVWDSTAASDAARRHVPSTELQNEDLTIDVMIVYTPDAADVADQISTGMGQLITNAFLSANAALENSELSNIHFNPVQPRIVDYSSSGDKLDDLFCMLDSDDQCLDGIHQWRDDSKADLVSLFIAPYVGGIALASTIGGVLDPQSAFSVVGVRSSVSSLVFAHEIGHNLGNAHSRNQDSNPAGEEGGILHEYATGWRWEGDDGNGYASVMTYEEGDVRVTHYSNPDVDYEGSPTGSYDESSPYTPADNAKNMAQTAGTVASFRDSIPPSAPTSLAASGDDEAVDLQWDQNTEDDLVAYRLYRDTAPTPTTIVDTLGQSGYFLHTDSTVTNGTRYYYRVTAVDRSGNESGFSNQASAVPSDREAPASPSELTAGLADTLSITLDWTASTSSDVDAYAIYRETTSNPTVALDTVEAGTLTYDDEELSENTTYYYRVAALDSSGNRSDYSSEVSTVTGDAIPPAPTELTASAEEDQVNLSWTASGAGDVASYHVHRGTQTSPTTILGSVGGTETNYIDTDITDGTTYYYRLTAVDEGGNESDYSNQVSATPEDETAPIAPTDFTAESADGTIQLTWTASASTDAVETLLYRSAPASGGDETLLATLASGATTHTDTSAAVSTRHYYRLKSRDDVGNESSFSSSASGFLMPTTVAYGITRNFGGADETSDYRLVALPGSEEMPVESVLEGEAGTGWTAYRQNESGTGLTSHREASSGFSFEAGAGLWVVAQDNLDRSAEPPAPEVNSDGTYAVELHEGWNIISNPFERNFEWSAVQEASGANEPLWSFAGGTYKQADSLMSASTEAEAFYFYNQEGRSELVLPYAPDTSSESAAAPARPASKGDAERDKPAASDQTAQWTLALTATRDNIASSEQLQQNEPKGFAATVRAGVAEGTDPGLDARDAFSPPGRFEPVSLGLIPEADSAELATAYRPPASGAEEGQHFQLVLRSAPSKEVTFRIDSGALPSGREALLIRKATGERYSLSETARFTPEAKQEQLLLLVGTPSFIEEAAREEAPSEPQLVGSYPNPFRGRATIAYDVAGESEVRLVVYDMLGRKVRTLVNETQSAGRKKATLRARALSSGVYVFRLKIGDHVETGRLVHVR